MLSNHYEHFAACYARGKLGLSGDDQTVLEQALAAELRLHRFKRSNQLPRVRKVLGALHSLAPDRLLDLGTGRGVFLWPLLEEFPELKVTCVDLLDYRVADLQAVGRGGIERLQALHCPLEVMPFADREFPVVTMLEVLEHTSDPFRALSEVSRVCERALLLSVPSHEDDNPEHLHLFSARQISQWLEQLGFSRIKSDG
ncbi:MAG TPA: class I SAM-dependent methyltransferase, partial [Myxococcota bacterium]|nr:class I SAM-dependent methyltransferase [Myxococcota bacterium]